jgi:hypothetical protein
VKRFLLAAVLIATAAARTEVTWDIPGNQFAHDYNRWAELCKKRMAVPVEQRRFLSIELEKAAWKQAERDFKVLEKTVRYY